MHLGDRVGILRRYLAGALEQKARGVNILLYGPTGTGKTELARYLAGVTGVPLFEVPVFDQVSGPLDGGERMCAYHTGQELFSDGGAAIMLFDDCEDVFPHEDHPGHGAVKQIGGIKGFRNMILEMNPVPSIWITNSIDHMDPAIVRRFSFHLEVKPPGRETAGKVLGRHLGGLPVGKDFVDRLAGHDVLTPADIESAARVTRIVAPAGGEAAERTLETVLKGRLAARGTGLGMFAESGGTARYSLDYLNTDCDINTLVDGIVQCGEARLLFFGPPGTGKTALAHYIAGKMGRPVVSRKASDILGRYVGETEKHLATMFDEARRARALLLLDEADGFLMDRRGAGQTWEVTQVNELLTQMESYKGVFVCSTNLVENLDQASSRRFDIKVRFRALDADRALDMFLGELDEAGIERPAGPELEQIRRGLGALALLTPGDFTTVRRKARIIGFGKDAAGLLDALRAEVDSKTCCGPKRQVGF
jgi:SpoVK/Ycf46/Vps4 family AAA+-type ATPase